MRAYVLGWSKEYGHDILEVKIILVNNTDHVIQYATVNPCWNVRYRPDIKSLQTAACICDHYAPTTESIYPNDSIERIVKLLKTKYFKEKYSFGEQFKMGFDYVSWDSLSKTYCPFLVGTVWSNELVIPVK